MKRVRRDAVVQSKVCVQVTLPLAPSLPQGIGQFFQTRGTPYLNPVMAMPCTIQRWRKV